MKQLNQKQMTFMFNYVFKQGKMISANSSNSKIRSLYDYIENNYEDISNFLQTIGFDIKKSDEYFYGIDLNENEKIKLQQISEIINIAIFLIISFKDIFSIRSFQGKEFRIDELTYLIDNNSIIKEDLYRLNNKKDISHHDKIVGLIDKLVLKSYIEKIDNNSQKYKILNSFGYLVDFVKIIEGNLDEK